jgi:hypothetical protein
VVEGAGVGVSCDDCADTGVKALYDSRGNRWAVRCACGQRTTAAWVHGGSASPATRGVPLSQGGMTSAPKVPDFPPVDW